MTSRNHIVRVEQVPIHYMAGTKPEIVAQDETQQIHDVKVVRNSPPTQEFMPLGYNREGILDRVAKASIWGFNVGLDPNFEEEYSSTKKINFESYVKSITVVNGINSNTFVWDPVPELENFPVSGYPNKVQQQYVLYNVNPSWPQKMANKVNVHQQSIPVAYTSPISTSKNQLVVKQTPVSAIASATTQNSFLSRLKTLLVGG